MANNPIVNGGLRLIDAVNGAGAGLEIVLIPSSDSDPTGIGDPVQQTAVSAPGGSIGAGQNVAECSLGSATSVVYGVVQCLLPQYTDGTGVMNLSQVYRSASTNEYALIRIANNQDVYQITDDGALAGLTVSHMNYNFKFTVNTCDTVTGLSKFYIDSANGATTATYPLKVIGPADDSSNGTFPVTNGYAHWRVNLNNVTRSGGTGTVGV